jgi:hypothetical protein
MMRRQFIVTVMLGTIILFAVAGIVLPLFQHTNCGGNSAALARCNSYSLIARVNAQDHGPIVDVSRFEKSDREQIASLANDCWLAGSKLLIRKSTDFSKKERMIIAVCDTPYSNVPQPTVWNLYRKTPAHAVGYSDGTTRLISPAEFRDLHFEDFIDASTLAEKSVSNPLPSIVKPPTI